MMIINTSYEYIDDGGGTVRFPKIGLIGLDGMLWRHTIIKRSVYPAFHRVQLTALGVREWE